ncbi:unnamed protein product [Pleuronectes platessa]|uniref:Uncharacterized protein n=1 Tax=Pleuronectes platessa TaxID=8262 RepID=A0A9N7TMA3_PLEPL|nr:unnamed protein product [Pleuronectes platessa]
MLRETQPGPDSSNRTEPALRPRHPGGSLTWSDGRCSRLRRLRWCSGPADSGGARCVDPVTLLLKSRSQRSARRQLTLHNESKRRRSGPGTHRSTGTDLRVASGANEHTS